MKIRLSSILQYLITFEASFICCVIGELIYRVTNDGDKVPSIGAITQDLNNQLVQLEPGLFHEGVFGRASIFEDWIRWPELHKYPSLFNLASVNGATTEQCGFLNGHQFRVEMVRYLIEKHGDIELTF